MWMGRRDGGKQVGCERRDAALARQMVADKRDLVNFRSFLQYVSSSGCQDQILLLTS